MYIFHYFTQLSEHLLGYAVFCNDSIQLQYRYMAGVWCWVVSKVHGVLRCQVLCPFSPKELPDLGLRMLNFIRA